MTWHHRRLWRPISFLLAVLLLGATLPAGGQSPSALESRPTILEFSRKLCPICREMERVLITIQGQYRHQFQVRLLHLDREEYLFKQYRITIVPSQVFLNTAEQEVFRHEGLFPREELLQKLRELKFIQD